MPRKITGLNIFPRKHLQQIAERIDYGHSAAAIQTDDGPWFLRITDIQNGMVNWQTVPRCKATPEEVSRYVLSSGDIVFARTGATTGKSFLIQDCPKDTLFASYLIRVRATKEIEPRFLFRFFETPDYWDQIKKNSRGAGQPGVNATSLQSLSVPIPSLSTQQKIADILDQAEKIKRMRSETVKLTEELLRSVFLDMFGDPITNSKGWPKRALKDLTLIDAPMVDPRKEEFLDLPHIGPERIEGKTGKILKFKTAREDRLISGKFLFNANHVLYSKIRPYLQKVAKPSEFIP